MFILKIILTKINEDILIALFNFKKISALLKFKNTTFFLAK